jgi:hypothetical protein
MNVYSRQEGNSNLGGDQCLAVHQILWLPAESEVWLMALTNTGEAETITTESRFGVEKIAV